MTRYQPLGFNLQVSLSSLNLDSDFQVENCFLDGKEKPRQPASTRNFRSSSLLFG